MAENHNQYWHNKGQEDASEEKYEPPHVPALVPVEREIHREEQFAYDKGWENAKKQED